MGMKRLQLGGSRILSGGKGGSPDGSDRDGDDFAVTLVRMGDRAAIAGRNGKAMLMYSRALRVFEHRSNRRPGMMVTCLVITDCP